MAELWTKKKKILSRKERFKISDDFNKRKDKEENLEKLLTQKEDEIQKLQIEEKIKYEKALEEYQIRYEKVKNNCDVFHSLKNQMVETECETRNNYIRQKYPEIKNLNRIVPWVNERISKWHDRKAETNILKTEINDCIDILSVMTDYTQNPLNLCHLEYWYECKRSLRDELYRKLDCVSYEIVKNIEKKMAYLDLEVMFYKKCDENISNFIWTVLDKPKSGKDDKFPLSCNFGDVGVIVNLPKTFHRKPIAVRCLWIRQDYFSEDCRTWKENAWDDENLLKYHENLWENEETKRRMQEDEMNAQLEKEKKLNIFNKIKHLIPSSSKENLLVDTKPVDLDEQHEKLREISLSKLVQLKKTPSQKTFDEDRNEIENIKLHFSVELDKFECNMRKYNIVGGIYHLELLKQPPQPRILKDGAILRMIIGVDNLQWWDYKETYEAPTVKTGVTKQSTDDDDDEDAENTPEGKLLSKLVLVTIKLPDHVLWFDAPVPVHWDSEYHYWSTQYIYEVKFNEEKQTLSFRAGKMTAFSLAVFKYNNFPYQSWELKPDTKSSVPQVTFSLTTSALVLEFLIRKNEISMTLLENANTTALQELIGIFYPPKKLVQILKQGGLNVFPSQDACLYVDGIPKKHHVTEDHLHHSMAYLSLCYKFSWSRWNLMAGYKKFVLQLRSIGVTKNELLLVSDQRTTVTECTDISQSFTEAAISGMKFYPDLLTLAEDYGGEDSKQIMSKMDPIFVETVYYFLSETRVMSFS